MRVPPILLAVEPGSAMPPLLAGAWASSNGIQVLSAHSGAEALAALEDTEADLVVCDEALPDMSGLDLCRALQSPSPRPSPAVLIIAPVEAGEDFLAEALSAGAEGVLQGPVAAVTLQSWCRTTLALRQFRQNLSEQERLLEAALETIRPCSRFAHDVNNPLQSSMSAADLLSLHYSEDDRIMNYAQQIQDSCVKLSALVVEHCRQLKGLLPENQEQGNL